MGIRIEISQKTLDSTIVPLLGGVLTRLVDTALQLLRNSQGAAAPAEPEPSDTQMLMAGLAGLPPTTPLNLSTQLVAFSPLERIVACGRAHADLLITSWAGAGSALAPALTTVLLHADPSIEAPIAAAAAEKICAVLQVWQEERARQEAPAEARTESLASVLATLTKLAPDTPISELVRVFMAAPVLSLRENGKGKWESEAWKQAINEAEDELDRLYPGCPYREEVVLMLRAMRNAETAN